MDASIRMDVMCWGDYECEDARWGRYRMHCGMMEANTNREKIVAFLKSHPTTTQIEIRRGWINIRVYFIEPCNGGWTYQIEVKKDISYHYLSRRVNSRRMAWYNTGACRIHYLTDSRGVRIEGEHRTNC